MRNETYVSVSAAVRGIFGRGESLPSGNGDRYRSAGKITVYHENLAPGNQVEIAFEPESIASRFGATEEEIRSLIEEIRRSTGNEINFNNQYRWPRIGIASQADAQLVVQLLRSRLLLQA